VAENWRQVSGDETLPIPSQEVLKFQQAYGQPWFLVSNRLARGETLDVLRLLQELAYLAKSDREPTPVPASVIAARYLYAQQLANHGDVAQAWLTGLVAQQSHKEMLARDATAPTESDWFALYSNLSDLPSNLLDHLPPSTPFPTVWTDEQKHQLQQLTDHPTAALCWVAAKLVDADPPDRKTLEAVLQQSFGQANKAQRELLNSCRKTIETIERWRANPDVLASDEVRYGYFDVERRWKSLTNPSNNSGDPAQNETKVDLDLERQKLVWQLRLEGLFLSVQADPQVVEAGQLRLLLLDHWGFKTQTKIQRP
jgi:hypothetical protein